MTAVSGDSFMTLQEFLAAHPEFCRNADRDHVESTLFLSRTRVAGEWGEHRKMAHGYMTAHMLAASPMGQQSRLDPKMNPMTTTYKAHFDELMHEVFVGISVT